MGSGNHVRDHHAGSGLAQLDCTVLLVVFFLDVGFFLELVVYQGQSRSVFARPSSADGDGGSWWL